MMTTWGGVSLGVFGGGEGWMFEEKVRVGDVGGCDCERGAMRCGTMCRVLA